MTISNIVAYTAKYILVNNDLIQNAAVLVENNVITDIVKLSELNADYPVKDFTNCVITPGFIDLQLNGCGGVLFNNEISHDTLDIMYQTCLRYGTTSFLPTLITCDFDDVLKALDCIKQWFIQYSSNRGVIGLHLEGPFISTAKNGIHPEQFIRLPNHELLEQIVAYTEYFPIKMTIAPEVFTHAQIKFLIEHNVILSLGHSNANYGEATSAINQGVRTATHIFNAMSGLSARNPGVIGAILNTDIYTGVIADLMHVDKANIQLLNKIKPHKTYLVTDSLTPMGTEINQFQLSGKTLWVKNGVYLDENNVLGGANLTMPEAIANCVKHCDIDLTVALKMASQIPAQIMGYSDSLGKIGPGYQANLIALNLETFDCSIITNVVS